MEAPRYSSIQEKIAQALALHDAWRESLRRDTRICGLLADLEKRLAASRKAMRAFGVARACKRCEEEEGGSCCGAGIENRYDPLELLINLLLGVSLPVRRRFRDSCYFLEPDGCSLKARHVLCVNYLCTRLQESLSVDERSTLQAILGEELDAGFILHEALRKTLGSRTPDRSTDDPRP